MKIDSAIKEFTEKYNQDMMQSIDDLSNNFGLNANRKTISVVNMKESVELFKEYLDGYKDYYISNPEQKLSKEDVIDRTKKFVENGCFESVDIFYKEIPTFVSSYIEGINSLSEMTNNVKRVMTEANIDSEIIGDVNDIVDTFTESMQNNFYTIIEKMLWASGYNASQHLAKVGRETTTKSSKPIFI